MDRMGATDCRNRHVGQTAAIWRTPVVPPTRSRRRHMTRSGRRWSPLLTRNAGLSWPCEPVTSRAVTIRDTLPEGFNYFVTYMAAQVVSGGSGCRVGLHLLESAALPQCTP